jgi:hypothetical protein
MGSPRRFPDLEGKTFLVCVGAMKAATSWLYAQLRALPAVVVSPLKEVHFFDARFPDNALMDADALAMARLRFHMAQPGDPVDNLRRRPAFQASLDRVRMIWDDDAYLEHFVGLARPETRLFADITPAYAVIGAEGFAFMRKLLAAQGMRVKILFVMRDPVERLWSHMRFLPQLRPATDPLRDWADLLCDPVTMARSDYRRTIEDLERVFPTEEILCLFYETLFDGGYADLCDALGLGLGRQDPSQGARYNETQLKADLPPAGAQAFRRALDAQYMFCAERFGSNLPEAWRNRTAPD